MSRELKFQTLAVGLDTSAVLAQLDAHPELWNAHPGRTREDSPHYGIPDIWVRYRAADELNSTSAFNAPHFPVFYPAWHALPALHSLVFKVMDLVKPHPTALGGILITKIPAGKEVKPHHDRGGWHAEFYDTKVYVVLKGNDKCVNYCEDESMAMETGDAVVFNNLLTHSVENRGDTDRMTLIVCLRTE